MSPEEFGSLLQSRLAGKLDLTFVRSDKFVLLGELLACSDLREALHLLGFEEITEPRETQPSEKSEKEKDLPLAVKLTERVEKFIQELVDSSKTEGEATFEFWPDTGAGSWIRLKNKKGSYGKNGNQNYSGYGYGSYSYGYRRGAGASASEEKELPAVSAKPQDQKDVRESSGRGALPGWITRAEPDVAAAGAREPAEAPAPVAPSSGQAVAAAASGRGASACKAWAGCDNWTKDAKAPAPPAPKPLAPAVPVAPAVFEVLDAGSGSALKKASNKMKLPEPEAAPPPPKADTSPTSPASPAPRPPPQAPASPSSRTEVVPPPPPPPVAESGTGARRNGEMTAAPEQVKKGRLRSFLLEKGFGFISLEDIELDVFVHVSTFEGQKPNDFPGLPGLPPVGQEVEFTVSEGHARPRAAWARITGPALPMDGGKVLCKSLGYVLQRPERYLDFRHLVKGWATLLHVLQHDLLKTAIEALAPEGAQKLSQGVLPEAVLAAIEDLAVCVVAPNAEAANEKIAAEGQDQFNFHVWLQQEAFLSDAAVPEAERLWIRHASRARSEEMRHRREETHPEDKPWWQGGGDTAAGAEWEPHHLKASHLNPSSDSCSSEDVLKVLAHLPLSAPMEVRRYLENWERKLRKTTRRD